MTYSGFKSIKDLKLQGKRISPKIKQLASSEKKKSFESAKKTIESGGSSNVKL